MSENKIHMHDLGVSIILRIKDRDTEAIVDISNASVMQIWFWKPSGAVIARDAVLYTDGTDGRMVYTSTSWDFDEEGVWKRQAYIELPSQILHGDIENMRVYSNLYTSFSFGNLSAYLAGA